MSISVDNRHIERHFPFVKWENGTSQKTTIELSKLQSILQLSQAAPPDCDLPNGDSRGRTARYILMLIPRTHVIILGYVTWYYFRVNPTLWDLLKYKRSLNNYSILQSDLTLFLIHTNDSQNS